MPELARRGLVPKAAFLGIKQLHLFPPPPKEHFDSRSASIAVKYAVAVCPSNSTSNESHVRTINDLGTDHPRFLTFPLDSAPLFQSTVSAHLCARVPPSSTVIYQASSFPIFEEISIELFTRFLRPKPIHYTAAAATQREQWSTTLHFELRVTKTGDQ